EVRGGEEDVDAGASSWPEGGPGAFDVAGDRTGQPGNNRAPHRFGDGADRVEVAFGRNREAGLDDVDAEPFELAGHAQLGGHRHAEAGRLLAVAQGGVEDADPL